MAFIVLSALTLPAIALFPHVRARAALAETQHCRRTGRARISPQGIGRASERPHYRDTKPRKRHRDGHACFVLPCACFALFVLQPLTFAANLSNLPPLARHALEPVTVDWPREIARLQDWTRLVPDPVVLSRPDWTGGLAEVDASSLWGTYFIECAKSGRLNADDLARVMTECKWTAEEVAAFWERLDYETLGSARSPEVAGQVLVAVEGVPHLREAFGETASLEALFGIA